MGRDLPEALFPRNLTQGVELALSRREDSYPGTSS